MPAPADPAAGSDSDDVSNFAAIDRMPNFDASLTRSMPAC
jgi:hypothetical protein